MDGQGQTCVATHDDYRRRARRIRAVYAGDPARLHRALRELASVQTQRVVAKPPGGKAQAFADLVSDSLDGPILRYSTRRSLLRTADSQGIGRFEANLIIAAVQHQADRQPPGIRTARNARAKTPAIAWLAILTIQSAIVTAIWMILAI